MSAGLKITGRDRVFMLFAPTIALAAAYFFFAARPMASEMASLRRRGDELGPAGEIAAGRPALEARLAKAREELAAAEAAAREDMDPQSVPSEPAERMRALRELFHRHGGDVLSSSLRDEEPQFGQAEPAPVALLKRSTGIAPHRWFFEIEAGYAGMAAALDELAESRPCVVYSLSMRPADTDGAPCAWRIELWM